MFRTGRRVLLRAQPVGSEPHFGKLKHNEPIPYMSEQESEARKPEVLMKDRDRIGWVGLGEMGMGMVWKIVKEPTASVHVWTRNERKLRAYASYVEEQLQRYVHQRPLLVDIPRFADVIIVSLANIRATREVLLERDDAILYNARPGTIVVDHSTVDIETTLECHEIASARGVAFLDAPIAGSPELAQTGALSVMVGGDEIAFRRIARILAKYAHCVEYMGEAGNGTKTKMIHEALLAMHTVASAEAALLARSMGVTDLDKLTRVMDSSLGGSNAFRRNAMYWPKQFESRTKIGTGQTIARLAKNLAILREYTAATELQPFLPTTQVAERVVNQCGDAGGYDADITSVLHFLHAEKPNLNVYWDVPVKDVEQNAQLEKVLNEQQLQAQDQETQPWSSVTEFDQTSEQPTLHSSYEPPTIDPARLESLYSKAKPTVAAGAQESLMGKTVQRAKYDVFEDINKQHPAIQRTMQKFSEVGKIVDTAFGKASFNGVAFQQRSPSLIDPVKGNLFEGDDNASPPSSTGEK